MNNIWRYVITVDEGKAPCIDNGLLTLCICKPVIRKGAKEGDWIMGFARKAIGTDLLVYIAKVDNKITIEDYCSDSEPRLDKIFKLNEFGNLVHYGGKIHSDPKSQITDLSGKYCIVSNNFWYFGSDYVGLPLELGTLSWSGRGQTKRTTSSQLQALEEFVSFIPVGIHGSPEKHIHLD